MKNIFLYLLFYTTLRQRFDGFYDAVQGKANSLFEKNEQLDINTAINKYFNKVNYGQIQYNTVAQHGEVGTEGRQAKPINTRTGERITQGEQSTERGGGVGENIERGGNEVAIGNIINNLSQLENEFDNAKDPDERLRIGTPVRLCSA
ncbi:hypothetical protein RDV77_01615 [Porphyromonadaceae sp. NP-X]|nr:hypothetical protein [Porphyromonadaceae sp. NP-X]